MVSIIQCELPHSFSLTGARPTILQIFRKVMRACVFPVRLVNQACVIVRSDEQ